MTLRPAPIAPVDTRYRDENGVEGLPYVRSRYFRQIKRGLDDTKLSLLQIYQYTERFQGVTIEKMDDDIALQSEMEGRVEHHLLVSDI